ncbi:MAG: T9SS type A sorting domain-containing protein [Candidatus Marinimicrobia bacterium]|nr:T9SS type A sorting domain-containing protein [Candidatus Neomarinimicrobiota bacterium]
MRKFNEVLLFTVGMIVAISLTADGIEPSGTPRQVSTLDHLLWISTNSSSWGDDFEQTNDINAASTSTWNSDGSGGYYGFSPIGIDPTYFTGTYDGKSYSISNLYIHRTGADHIGLFGYTDGSTIQNVSILDCNITGNLRVGSLVGRSYNYSEILKCFATGTVTATTSAGGLVGENYEYSSIEFSYCNVNVSAGDYAGGLIATNNVQGSLRNCYARGTVTGNRMVGGLIGYSLASTSYYCYATGTVTGNQYVGGFLGSYNSYAPSSSCFYDATTTGQNDTGKGIPKSTSEMKTESTFTNASWDFTINGENDDWALEVGKNDGYPYLVWALAVDSSLPVELSEWAAQSKSGNITLNWTTESETENLGFIIERKNSDQKLYKEIASFTSHEALKGQGSTIQTTAYHFIDKAVEVGQIYHYRLSDVDYQGKRTDHAEISIVVKASDEIMLPARFSLKSCYPNPFNPSTTISYELTEAMIVTLHIFDVQAREVYSQVSESQSAGTYEVQWNGKDADGAALNSGIYIARLEAGASYSQSLKLIYLQ